MLLDEVYCGVAFDCQEHAEDIVFVCNYLGTQFV